MLYSADLLPAASTFWVIYSPSDSAGNTARNDVAAFYKLAAFNPATLVRLSL